MSLLKTLLCFDRQCEYQSSRCSAIGQLCERAALSYCYPYYHAKLKGNAIRSSKTPSGAWVGHC